MILGGGIEGEGGREGGSMEGGFSGEMLAGPPEEALHGAACGSFRGVAMVTVAIYGS